MGLRERERKEEKGRADREREREQRKRDCINSTSLTTPFLVRQSLKAPVLELTVNYNSDEVYHNGNSEPLGFGHIAFLVDDVERASATLEEAGVSFKKKPSEGSMHNISFALDPDGYHVELVQRGTTF
jgi:lactoylglutathione lyase